MFDKVKKLVTDNSVKGLITGNMTLSDEIINKFLGRAPLPPELKRVTVLCRDGIIDAEGEGEISGVKFAFQGGIRLLAVKFSRSVQMLRIMPAEYYSLETGALKVKTEIDAGPGFLREVEALLKLAPHDMTRGVSVDSDALVLNLHENPIWAREFAKRVDNLPLARDLGINPLDFMVVDDVKIEPGRVRLITRRA